MREVSIIFLVIFQIAFIAIKSSASENLDLKNKAVKSYDEGKINLSISFFQTLANKNKTDAFFSYLNIAILEFERKNLIIAKEYLNKASQIRVNAFANTYLSNCKSILGNSNKLKVISEHPDNDPSQKLLLWQFQYYSINGIVNDNLIIEKNLIRLKKDIVNDTYRHAKVLSRQAFLNHLKEEETFVFSDYSSSNRILEKLRLKNSCLYFENVKNLFFYSDEINSEDLIKYENDAILKEDKEILAAINLSKGKYLYFKKNNTEEAYHYIKKAYEYSKDDPYVLFFLAYISNKCQNFEVAADYYLKLKTHKEYKIESFLGAAQCYLNAGKINLAKKYATLMVKAVDFNTSLNFLSRISSIIYSLNQFEDFFRLDKYIAKYEFVNPHEKDLATIHYIKGNYLWFSGDYRRALDQYQLAILNIVPDEKSLNIYENLDYRSCKYQSGLIEYLNAKGESFYQLSKHQKSKKEEIRDLKECLKNLNLSIEQMYLYKMQLSTEEQMYMFSELRSKRYPNIIKVCLELYNKTGDDYYYQLAFKYAEQGRATVMLSMLRGNKGSNIGLIPEKFKAQEDSISHQISLLNQRLTAVKGESQVLYSLNTQIDKLVAKRTELEQMYKKQYPAYYQLKYSSEVISAPEFQKTLAENECVVEFLLDRNFLISYYIDKNNLDIVTDTLQRINLSHLAERFCRSVNHFSAANYSPDSIKQFSHEAQLLYQILLKPFESKFKGKKLIIIADNSLRKIPFEVLLTGIPANYSGYRNLPYLIKQNAVYYAPSITFLHELRQRPKIQSRAKLLAVAPVYPSLRLNDTLTRMLLAVRADTSIFGSLPNAQKEVDFAHAIAGGKYLAEKQATETRFKKIAQDYDIIHLATHGILNPETSLQSRLLFADSQPADDGFLHNYEIYNLKQSAQLVILSACNTGAGKNYGGEEVISFGRGFLSSGSRSVIMTLWPVNDQSSYELIRNFYEELKENQSINDALRESKLKYLSNTDNLHTHPFFWTGYVIYGDASIQLKIVNYFPFYLAGAGLVLLIALGFLLRANAKNSTIRKLLPYKKIAS